MNICIVGYYNLADGYLSLAKELEKNNFYVSFFPFMHYYNHKILCHEYFNDFINCRVKEKNPECNEILPLNKVDILLFFLPTLPIKDFLSKIDIIKIYFNRDMSYNNIDNDHWLKNRDILLENIPYFTLAFSTNPLEVELYKKNGYNCTLCNMGFSSLYSFPPFSSEKDNNYKCDVSFVITNLYTDSIWDRNKQKVNRKELLDLLYNDKTINLKIYGPEYLKHIYKDSYFPWVDYKDCNKVWANSKINVSIHCVNIDYYLSERVAQIIGSGGLLYTDNLVGLNFKANKDYILAKNGAEECYLQIKNLLQDEGYLLQVKENGYKKRESLSIENFVNQIKTHLRKHIRK